MTGTKRRQEIVHLLTTSKQPMSGSALAEKLKVSRQVIVQDVALLRASDCEILSTPKGYMISKQPKIQRVLKVKHGDEEIEDELNTVVDLGGSVIDVLVDHKPYGKLRADLAIHSRRNVRELIQELSEGKASPLKNLTSGVHWHTVEADSEEVLDLIEEELKAKGYLIS